MLLVLGCGAEQPVPVSQEAPVSALEREEAKNQETHFALMRGRPEPPPRSLAKEVEAIGGIPSLAQRLPLLTQEAWVFPGPGRLCLVAASGGPPSLACTRLGRVLKAGTFIASVPANGLGSSPIRSVIGLVPDGVAKVRIHASGARPITVSVEENVFALRDKGRAFPESIELVRSG